MEKEDIAAVAQILTGMKDAIKEIELAQKKKDFEKIAQIKKEILRWGEEIDKIL